MNTLRTIAVISALAATVAPATAQQATYKQKRECVTVAAQGSKMIGSIGTTDPVIARLMQTKGLANGPIHRYGDGWTIGEIWSGPTGAYEECSYKTDYSEREITVPSRSISK